MTPAQTSSLVSLVACAAGLSFGGCTESESSGASSASGGPSSASSSTGGLPGPDASAPGSDGGIADGGRPLGTPRVYVGSGDGKIRVFSFDPATATLSPISTVAAGQNPSFLAFAPDQRSLYAVDEGASQLQAFAVASPTGTLSPLNSVGSGGNGPAHVSVDRAGKVVMVANYGGATIAVFPRMADGRLGTSSASRSFGGGAQTHQIVTDPTNTFVLVPNKGRDSVSVFRLEAGGALTDVPGGAFAAGDGARHVDLDPSGKRAYVVDELGSTITAMNLDPTTGALASFQTISTLPDGFQGQNTGAEIQLTPDGKHVLASNRGDDSIAVFDIDGATGRLTRTARVATGGASPRHFSIDATGRFLFVGNQGAGNVVVMKVDPVTGIPAPVGPPVAVPSPAFVALVYLDP